MYFDKEKLEGEMKELDGLTDALERTKDFTPAQLCKLRAFVNNRKVEIKYQLDPEAWVNKPKRETRRY